MRYIDDGLTVVVLSNTNTTPMDETTFEIARKFSRDAPRKGAQTP